MRKAIPFFISQAITLFGSQVVAFVIIWYITRETSSGVWVALLTISSFLPQFNKKEIQKAQDILDTYYEKED